MVNRTLMVLVAAGQLYATPAAAQKLSATALDAMPPDLVAAPLRGLLNDRGVRVSAGEATIDFWWAKALTAEGAGAFAWSSVAEGTFVGAAKVTGKHSDIRGRTIREGVYTLRIGIQPQNGDHLGVSPYREFLHIIPAASDSDGEPAGHEGAVELSKVTIKSSHPALWSLDPPVAESQPLSVVTNDAGHQAVIFEIGVSSSGKTQPVRFGLILIGKIEA
jgi:hypothetical protein